MCDCQCASQSGMEEKMASKLSERTTRQPVPTARQIMNPLVYSVRANAPLEEAIQLMVSQHISGVPVVDEDRRVLGVLTEADLIDEEKRKVAVPRTLLYGVMPLSDSALCEATRREQSLRVRDPG